MTLDRKKVERLLNTYARAVELHGVTSRLTGPARAALIAEVCTAPRCKGCGGILTPADLCDDCAETAVAVAMNAPSPRAGRDATPDAEEVRLLRGLVAAMSRQISEVLTLPDLPLSVPLRSALCSMQEHAESARIRAGRDARATPGTARVRGGEGDAE